MLQGLSPKQNREIPPLNYEFVYRIQEEFPHCKFILNGGLKSIDHALDQLKLLGGIMLGRAPYQNPYILSELEQRIFGQEAISRLSVVDRYVEYGKVCLEQGEQAGHLLRHLLGLFNGCPGAVKFRRHLSDTMHNKDAPMEIVYDALEVSGLAATDPKCLDTQESHVKND